MTDERSYHRHRARSPPLVPRPRLSLTRHRVESRMTALIEVTGMRVSIPASLLITR